MPTPTPSTPSSNFGGRPLRQDSETTILNNLQNRVNALERYMPDSVGLWHLKPVEQSVSGTYDARQGFFYITIGTATATYNVPSPSTAGLGAMIGFMGASSPGTITASLSDGEFTIPDLAEPSFTLSGMYHSAVFVSDGDNAWVCIAGTLLGDSLNDLKTGVDDITWSTTIAGVKHEDVKISSARVHSLDIIGTEMVITIEDPSNAYSMVIQANVFGPPSTVAYDDNGNAIPSSSYSTVSLSYNGSAVAWVDGTGDIWAHGLALSTDAVSNTVSWYTNNGTLHFDASIGVYESENFHGSIGATWFASVVDTSNTYLCSLNINAFGTTPADSSIQWMYKNVAQAWIDGAGNATFNGSITTAGSGAGIHLTVGTGLTHEVTWGTDATHFMCALDTVIFTTAAGVTGSTFKAAVLDPPGGPTGLHNASIWINAYGPPSTPVLDGNGNPVPAPAYSNAEFLYGTSVVATIDGVGNAWVNAVGLPSGIGNIVGWFTPITGSAYQYAHNDVAMTAYRHTVGTLGATWILNVVDSTKNYVTGITINSFPSTPDKSTVEFLYGSTGTAAVVGYIDGYGGAVLSRIDCAGSTYNGGVHLRSGNHVRTGAHNQYVDTLTWATGTGGDLTMGVSRETVNYLGTDYDGTEAVIAILDPGGTHSCSIVLNAFGPNPSNTTFVFYYGTSPVFWVGGDGSANFNGTVTASSFVGNITGGTLSGITSIVTASLTVTTSGSIAGMSAVSATTIAGVHVNATTDMNTPTITVSGVGGGAGTGGTLAHMSSIVTDSLTVTTSGSIAGMSAVSATVIAGTTVNAGTLNATSGGTLTGMTSITTSSLTVSSSGSIAGMSSVSATTIAGVNVNATTQMTTPTITVNGVGGGAGTGGTLSHMSSIVTDSLTVTTSGSINGMSSVSATTIAGTNVNATSDMNTPTINATGGPSGGGAIIVGVAVTYDVVCRYLFVGGSGSAAGFGYDTTGSVDGTGVASLFANTSFAVMGNLYYSGTLTHYSDIRLKENIATIVNPLDSLRRLRGVSFRWKETGDPGMGFIAQEVQEVFPDLVLGKERENENLKLNSIGLIAPLWEACKALMEEVQQLREDVNILKGS